MTLKSDSFVKVYSIFTFSVCIFLNTQFTVSIQLRKSDTLNNFSEMGVIWAELVTIWRTNTLLLTKTTSLNTTHSDGDSETAPYRILCEIVIQEYCNLPSFSSSLGSSSFSVSVSPVSASSSSFKAWRRHPLTVSPVGPTLALPECPRQSAGARPGPACSSTAPLLGGEQALKHHSD